MSSEKLSSDFPDFDSFSNEMNKNIDERLRQNSMLNLKSFYDSQSRDLADMKKARKEMIVKRDALNEAIMVVERRIEATIVSMASIQKPF